MFLNDLNVLSEKLTMIVTVIGSCLMTIISMLTGELMLSMKILSMNYAESYKMLKKYIINESKIRGNQHERNNHQDRER